MPGGGSFAPKRITDAITLSDDAFDKRIADTTGNTIDLGSHYNFSPERLRLFKNGSRQFVQYGETSNFTDGPDTWNLEPAGGDTMHIESAESITYVVNYEILASWALELNQSLQSGDVVRFGPYNGTDGWVVEQRGADHADDEVDIIESSAGTETTLASGVELDRPLTDWTRFEVRYNWYGVGHQKVKQTYTVNGTQLNEVITRTSNDGERGPETGNLNLWYEIQADANTSGLELHCGSSSGISLGDPVALNRDKPQYVEVDLPATDNTWLPIYAVRIASNNQNVNARFTTLDILNYSNNAIVELVAANVDADKTDIADSEFVVPDYHHDQNSALRRAIYTDRGDNAVFQVPNTSGTQTTLGSSEKFGGYTIATSVIQAGGNTTATSATRSSQVLEKKNILNSDHTVFLARTGNGGGTLRFVWDGDQDW